MNKSNISSVTLIMFGTNIIGDVAVEHDLRVEGYIKGTVKVGGLLTVIESGKIEGEVITRSAVISGHLIGNIRGEEKIVLEGKSNLMGDLNTRMLIINEGASFQGNCKMNGEEKLQSLS